MPSNKPSQRTPKKTESSPPARRKASKPSARRQAGVAAPSYDDIARAAYLRYLQRGGRNGSDFDDWLEAERELKSRSR